MRQTHLGGEKLFVDYAGDTVPVIVNQLTGETRAAQIFVAVMGASNLTYAEATWTQSLPDWIAAHTHAFEAIGGVPKLLVPDNTKVAVIKACRYDPQVNRTYAEMADHYDIGILPARPRKPRDKAKVEACVLIVERYLLGRLRHRRFYSLAELNQAIRTMLIDINEQRPLRRLGITRRRLFEDLDRPMLKPLPAEPYVYAEWHLRRAGLDYHVEVEGHYYSVPYRFANEALSVRLTARIVEVFRKGERIAAHQRNSGNHKHTTINEHMPSSHRRFADWTIERLRREASAVGSSTAMLCELILESRRHPEQGFRACMGTSGSSNPMAGSGSRRPACEPWRSAPAPIDPSNPSSTTISIAKPPPNRRLRRSSTPTSAVRVTTTERVRPFRLTPAGGRACGDFAG
jgi:transposase